jgi:FtsH-binding integral membrane protein
MSDRKHRWTFLIVASGVGLLIVFWLIFMTARSQHPAIIFLWAPFALVFGYVFVSAVIEHRKEKSDALR